MAVVWPSLYTSGLPHGQVFAHSVAMSFLSQEIFPRSVKIR